MTRKVIESDFNNEVLGNMLNKCIDEFKSIESAIAFASVIAKAKLTRSRRNR